MHGLGQETYRAFVMTDVVGSTILTQHHPIEYGNALAKHNLLAEQCFASSGGKLLKSRGQGDGLLGEFEAPADAVRAALSFRSALSREINELSLNCRIAIHYGVCYGDGEDYYGHTLNLCARLRDVGHANQILISGIAAELAQQLSSEGMEFIDLGWHGLKDISSATQILQVGERAAPERYPRLKTDARFRMPSFGTTFIGRQAELERISKSLETHRLVQLLAPGGMGKTRLAVRATETLSRELGYPCAFANLIEALDAASVEHVLADTLGQSRLGELAKSIEPGLILVVDNCEHVLEEATRAIAFLLDAYPSLRIIATTRSRLVLPGCATLNLDGLEIGDSGSSCFDLFVALAKDQDDTFEVRPEDEGAIEAICQAAEGVPLIIELAAYYVHNMSVSQIQERLYELARVGAGSGRHASIDAVLTATVEPLSQEAKQTCGHLAWLASGFTFEAATAIVGSAATSSIKQLTDASLLRFDRTAQPGPRYRFLEVIRVFLRDTLGG
ncbi:MAG: adenylate/guanylate cyclase domain-containing protein, partial [Fimbriimonadaceae bacterium]